MKRKLFCLLTLLLTVCSGAWGAPTEIVIFDGTNSSATYLATSASATDPTTGFTWTVSSEGGFKSGLVDVTSYTNAGSYKKGMRYNGQTNASKNWLSLAVPTGYTATVDVVYGLITAGFKFGLNKGAAVTASGSNCSEWNDSPSSITTLFSASVENLATGTYYLCGNKDQCLFAYIKVTLTPLAKSYTITLDDNGGTADGTATATEGSNTLTDITKPTYAEHSVVGYYKEAELTNLIADASGNLQTSTEYTDAGGNWIATENKTLYTKWAAATYYSVTYNNNGADSGSVPTDETDYEAGDEVTVIGNTGTLKKSGYTFIGWNTAPDGTGQRYIADERFYMGSENIILYAEWIANDYAFAPSESSGSISNGDIITVSTGGKMIATIGGTTTTLSYASSTLGNCVQFGYDKEAGTGAGGITVTLDKKMQVGTIITGTLYWSTAQANRGVDLQNASGTKKSEWYFNAPDGGGSATFTYTVVAGDGLAGSNVFKLVRKNSVHLLALSVINCANEYVITPAYDMSTYVTPAALDFSGVDGLTAYVATGKGTGTVVMSPVTAVPADTPLLLVGTASTPYSVPVAAEASAPGTNYLKKGPQTFEGTEEDKYILWTDGKFHLVAAGTLAANKAYLDLAEAGARELSIIFENEGETTAINAALMNNERMNNEVYNLNGQRVAQPTKGLYIVNGRKVVIK